MEERNYLASMDFVGNKDITISQYFCNNNFNEKLETSDSLDLDDNECIKIQRIGMTTLKGDEDWFYDEETQTYYYFQFNKFCNDISGKYDKMLCTHFRWVESTNILNWGEFQGDYDNKVMFKFDKENVECGNIIKFKEWLKEQFDKGTPVQVYYILQYPEISFHGNDYIPSPRFLPSHEAINVGDKMENKVHKTHFLQFESLIK